MRARTPRVIPTPMPAFAPVLRPVLGWGAMEVLVVVVAAAAAALGGCDDEEDVGFDEDEVAAAADADHVVAERSDLHSFSRSIYTRWNSLMSCRPEIYDAWREG